MNFSVSSFNRNVTNSSMPDNYGTCNVCPQLILSKEMYDFQRKLRQKKC